DQRCDLVDRHLAGLEATLTAQHHRSRDTRINGGPALEQAETKLTVRPRAFECAGVDQPRKLREHDVALDRRRSPCQFQRVDEVGRGWRHGARIIVTTPSPVKADPSLNPCFSRIERRGARRERYGPAAVAAGFHLSPPPPAA